MGGMGHMEPLGFFFFGFFLVCTHFVNYPKVALYMLISLRHTAQTLLICIFLIVFFLCVSLSPASDDIQIDIFAFIISSIQHTTFSIECDVILSFFGCWMFEKV
jgi:hypothetical protein